MNQIYENIKNKRIVIFGVGIIQADLLGLLQFENLQYYICDSPDMTDDARLLDVPCYHSERLLHEDRTDLFIIICENDECYANRKLEKMGFIEGKQYCFAEDILFEYAHGKQLPTISHIWGAAGTFLYHKEDIKNYIKEVKSFIVSDMNGVDSSFQNLPVISFDEYQHEENNFILVCSIYYKNIGKKLIEQGLLPGKDFINVRTFIKLMKYAFSSDSEYKFINRSKGAENLLIVLAGYKPFVWNSVFGRIKAYVPQNFDIVLVSSGKYDTYLVDLCQINGWSYVSIEKNNVSMALNIGISLFSKAKYIWKMDEDIIVTEGCFEEMEKAYQYVANESRYEIGFVSPILNVNGYGHVKLLERMNCVKEWEEKFGELKITNCYTHHVAIHYAPEAALFMWGKENPKLSDVDMIAETLKNKKFQFSVCPVRFSIGFIMFSRQDWIRMGMFWVTDKLNLGADEEHICQYCLMNARIMAIAENAYAGHLSYGPQHKVMEEYYRNNESLFLLKN